MGELILIAGNKSFLSDRVMLFRSLLAIIWSRPRQKKNNITRTVEGSRIEGSGRCCTALPPLPPILGKVFGKGKKMGDDRRMDDRISDSRG